MSTCKQAILNHPTRQRTTFNAIRTSCICKTKSIGVYCLILIAISVLYPAVGRSQWAVDSEYRFGFATSVAGPTNSIQTTMNPALMRGTSFSLILVREYGLSELQSGFLSVVHSKKRFSFGVQLGTFGYSLYREWHSAGSISYKLDSSKIGLALVSDRVSIAGYGIGVASSLRLGTQISLRDGVNLGMVADKILISRFGSIRMQVPTNWILALNWKWINQAEISGGIQSEISHPPAVSIAIKWRPISHLNVNIAHQPSYGKWVVGFQLDLDKWTIPLGGIFHSELGWSTLIGLGWRKS